MAVPANLVDGKIAKPGIKGKAEDTPKYYVQTSAINKMAHRSSRIDDAKFCYLGPRY